MDWSNYYNVNKGDAYVIQGNPALAELKSSFAQQQANKQREDAAFNANLAKLNFGGAKDADFDKLHKDYTDILNTHQALRNTQDPVERQKLSLALQQKQNGLMYNIGLSKENHAQELKAAELQNHPNANLSPVFQTNWQAMNKASSFDPKYTDLQNAFHQNAFAPKAVDWNAETGKIVKDLTDKSTKTAFVKDPTTGQLVNQRTVTSTLDKDAYMTGIANSLKDPNKLKVAMRDFGGNDPVETAQNIFNATYPAYASKLHDDVTTGNPFETADQKLARSKELALWKRSNGLDKAPQSPTYFQDLSERMRTGVPGSGEEFSKYLEADPNYHKGLGIENAPDKITITVPAKMKKDKDGVRVVDKPSYKVSLDKTDPAQWTAAFARLYKDITGDGTATPTKAMTDAGKGHVKGGLSPRTPAGTPLENKHKKAATDYGL